jgi:hypothetical protein
MNRNKKTKNVKMNKAIENMGDANSVNALKAMENKGANNNLQSKKDINQFE